MAFISTAQDLYNNLIVKSDDSTSFTISVNGFQQNPTPNNNIKITHIYDQSITIQINIVDSISQIIKKQIYFEKKEMETNAKLIHLGDKYKFRFISEVNLGQAAIDSTQLIISYNEKNAIISIDETPNKNDTINIISDTNSVVNDSTSSPNNINYSGKIGCSQLSGSIQSIITELDKEIFSDQKMKLAKHKIQKNCFLTSDIIKIIEQFEFEDHKLELAKFSFAYTYDIDNYNKIILLLDFDSSKKSFNKFIQQK